MREERGAKDSVSPALESFRETSLVGTCMLQELLKSDSRLAELQQGTVFNLAKLYFYIARKNATWRKLC